MAFVVQLWSVLIVHSAAAINRRGFVDVPKRDTVEIVRNHNDARNFTPILLFRLNRDELW